MNKFKGLLFGSAVILTLAAFHPARSAQDVVDGFGKNVPLSRAIHDIVPSGYVVTYGRGVDSKTLVSWRGGSDWQSVLHGITSGQHHFGVEISGSNVMIIDADAAYDASGSSTKGAAPAPSRQTPITQGGLVILPYHPAPAPAAQTAAAPPPASTPSQPSSTPVVAESLAAKTQAAPAAGVAPTTAANSTPAPVKTAAAAVAAVAAAPLAVAAASSQPEPASNPSAPVAAPAAPPTNQDATATPSQPMKPMTARERRQAALAAKKQQHESGAMSSASSPPASLKRDAPAYSGEVWRAKQGRTLDQVLGDWADKAGWTLVFNSRIIYELQASADFDGDFVSAASSLVKSVRANPLPLAVFYRGNKTLVVSNHADQTN